jgi:hypothetical protein
LPFAIGITEGARLTVFASTKGTGPNFHTPFLIPMKGQTMTHTMTSYCALAEACARCEDDAGKHLLNRTYADFSEELIQQPDSTTTCPFFMDKHDAVDAQARLH